MAVCIPRCGELASVHLRLVGPAIVSNIAGHETHVVVLVLPLQLPTLLQQLVDEHGLGLGRARRRGFEGQPRPGIRLLLLKHPIDYSNASDELQSDHVRLQIIDHSLDPHPLPWILLERFHEEDHLRRAMTTLNFSVILLIKFDNELDLFFRSGP